MLTLIPTTAVLCFTLLASAEATSSKDSIQPRKAAVPPHDVAKIDRRAVSFSSSTSSSSSAFWTSTSASESKLGTPASFNQRTSSSSHCVNGHCHQSMAHWNSDPAKAGVPNFAAYAVGRSRSDPIRSLGRFPPLLHLGGASGVLPKRKLWKRSGMQGVEVSKEIEGGLSRGYSIERRPSGWRMHAEGQDTGNWRRKKMEHAAVEDERQAGQSTSESWRKNKAIFQKAQSWNDASGSTGAAQVGMLTNGQRPVQLSEKGASLLGEETRLSRTGTTTYEGLSSERQHARTGVAKKTANSMHIRLLQAKMRQQGTKAGLGPLGYPQPPNFGYKPEEQQRLWRQQSEGGVPRLPRYPPGLDFMNQQVQSARGVPKPPRHPPGLDFMNQQEHLLASIRTPSLPGRQISQGKSGQSTASQEAGDTHHPPHKRQISRVQDDPEIQSALRGLSMDPKDTTEIQSALRGLSLGSKDIK